jgi:hypothetical protein
MQTRMRHFAGFVTLVLALFALALPAQAADTRSGKNFDHMRTGFPLTGAHAQIECQDCHVRGVFKGTPSQCQLCHTQGGRIAASAKPATHVPTNDRCDLCHTSTVSWAGARFTHSGVNPGDCMRCHNGRTATGKPANHVQTTASCDSCHRMTAWLPAGFNHAGVTPGGCALCHNGTTAPGKHATHVQTTASCDTCHRTTAWLPASFSHANVTPGTCNQCHNGTAAPGKHARHIPTTGACDQCHRTTAWQPTLGVAAVHAGTVPGTCGTCHNGNYDGAVSKSGSHFVTTRSCDACHSTTAWTPTRYTHTAPYYVAHSAAINSNCAGCHASSETVTGLVKYSPPPTCYGCHTHTTSFEPGPHKKTETPATNYTAMELHNCSGSCHFYQTTVGGALKESRPGPRHTPTNGRGMQ